MTDKLVHSLEKASTYLGYKDSFAKPALRYHIFESIEHKEPSIIFQQPTCNNITTH